MKKKKIVLPLLCMVLLLAACRGTEDAEALTPVAMPTESAVETTPTKLPTFTPTPTQEPTPSPIPTVTPTQEPTVTPAPTDVPKLTYATVTPVPQSEVVDIVGAMTIDTYPVVDGSTATLPLSEAVFMAATGESAEVAAEQVVHTKTTNSYTRLYEGEVDLLIVYEPAQSIVERMQTEPLCIKPIGLDALVFMANQANSVDSLTLEQLVDIYSGKINNWSEVGGSDKKLLAFQRPLGSGSQTLMQKLVMGDVEMVTGDNVFRYSTMADILEGMLSYNNEDNTLGYSVFYYANNMYFEKDLKFMAVNGVLPSTQTIYDGSYILDNAFYAVVRTDEPEDSNARKIFDWLTGEAGQQLVLDLGYVPVQMPEGAVITNQQTEQPEKVELLATEPLAEGQRFVVLNPQNTSSDIYYGDVTVYDADWKELVNFYNVTLAYNVAGIYEQRYLPIGQIRQNTEGEQAVYYGIYDLEKLEYSVYPAYFNLAILDEEKGYYAVPDISGQTDTDRYTSDYRLINGAGEVLGYSSYGDWLEIFKFGNGYLDRWYRYAGQSKGSFFYDKNMKLQKVFCTKETQLPTEADRESEVEYYLIGSNGCLVDENAELLITEELFLNKYGDGVDMECKLPFYYVTEADEGEVYEIIYKNQRYVVDRDLNLIYHADITEREGEHYSFNQHFYRFRDMYKKTHYYTYDGKPLTMNGATEPDGIQLRSGKDGDAYMLYKEITDRFIVETHQPGQAVMHYPIFKDTSADWTDIWFDYSGYVVKQESYGETMPSPYSWEKDKPVYVYTLYYQGQEIGQSKGRAGDYITLLEDGYACWSVLQEETLPSDKESVFEEESSQPVYDIYFLKDGELLDTMEDAYRFYSHNGVYFLLKGNYLYAIGYDGTEYVKALRSFMALD